MKRGAGAEGPNLLDLSEEQLTALSARLERGALEAGDYATLKAVIDTLRYLRRAQYDKDVSLQRALRMIFGASTEKTRNVLPEESAATGGERGKLRLAKKKKRKGHGRHGVNAYWGADHIPVPHGELKAGQTCPACGRGKIHDTGRPAVLVRLHAQPPIAGKVFEAETLRCGLCQQTFTAKPPVEAGAEKYDPNVAPMLASLRYGYGMPMNRLAQMQVYAGVPLPAGTQWGLIQEHAQELAPVLVELKNQAARSDLVHNDDTTARILSLEKEIRAEERAAAPDDERLRTGVFTSGIVAQTADRTIALFSTGRKHAGENLQSLLDLRPAELGPPIQMCDALSRNEPEKANTILGNCNAHGRRGFVDCVKFFPEECRHVLSTLQQVYQHDDQAKAEHLTPEQRLLFHQQHSGPLMEDLRLWLERNLEDKQIEPNSALGQAMTYMLKHWQPLTLFLRQPGAPLDNNICERALKLAIRHRNNSLFYKTQNGARVGDLFMSIVHTCCLNRVDPFHYLCALRRHLKSMRQNPAAWMPWNYRTTLASLPGG
jgi:hypothetical protein